MTDRTATSDYTPPASPAEIEADIQRTRARMTEHVDALSWKLSPERLKAEARQKLHETQEAVVDKVRDTAHEVGEQAKQAGSGFVGLLKENPIPAAMIGAGLAWLIVESRRDSSPEYVGYGEGYAERYGRYYNPASYTAAPAGTVGSTTGAYAEAGGYGGASAGYETDTYGTGTGGTYSGGMHVGSEEERGFRERAGEKAAHLRDRVSDTTSGARDAVRERTHAAGERASELASSARERASDLSHAAADRARRTKGWAEHQMEDNPLVVGAAVLALGAVVGSLVPSTRKEDELVGARRDALMDRARGSIREARTVIGETARETLASAREEAGYHRETLKQTAGDLGSELKTSAKKVAHDAKQTARSEAENRNLM